MTLPSSSDGAKPLDIGKTIERAARPGTHSF
jgi:hypothetical protein